MRNRTKEREEAAKGEQKSLFLEGKEKRRGKRMERTMGSKDRRYAEEGRNRGKNGRGKQYLDYVLFIYGCLIQESFQN